MALLKKYQIDALKTEIYNKIQNTPNPEREKKEYKTYVSTLTQKLEELEEQRSKLKKQLKQVENQIKDRFDFTVWMGGIKESDIQKQADKVFNIEDPSQSQVERTIILTDLDGSDDIVTTVLEKLGYTNTNN